MRKIYLFIIIQLLAVSCSGQDSATYYKGCMDKYLLPIGLDFYKNMSIAEEFLIQSKVLEGKSRMNYIEAFKKLQGENDLSSVFKELKKNVIPEELNSFSLQLFSLCSDIKPDETKIYCNCLNIHKNLLKKFVFRPYDDGELLDDMFLFTDFEDNTLRMHITYLFLLNVELKYNGN